MTDADLGEWYGVAVDAEGRVIKLDLNSNKLTGPILTELGQLSALEVLRLSNNKLTGQIPAELGQLEALAELNLSWNQLSGQGQEALRLNMQDHNPECTLVFHLQGHFSF
jgi:hypothetical protein